MKTNEELETEIEDLKKELYYISMQLSSTDSSGSGSGSGTTTPSKPAADDDGWVLLYDKDSEDESINLGITDGIHGEYGELTDLPDLINYSKLKMIFFSTNSEQAFIFEITNREKNGHRLMHNSGSLNQIFSAEFTTYLNTDGKFVLYIGKIMQIYFYSTSGKTPVISNAKTENAICFRRIYAK